MKAFWNKLVNEPVLLTGLVTAILVLLVQFNVPLAEGQINAIQAVIAAVAILFARSRVTPTRKLDGDSK